MPTQTLPGLMPKQQRGREKVAIVKRGKVQDRTGDANPNAVRGAFFNPFLDSKICVLDGTNLRQLREGLGLCSPGIILQGKDNPKLS